MMPRWRVLAVLAVLLMLAGAAVPPVIEDHLEPGFCSADCPVQHDGHGSTITSPGAAFAAHRTRVISTPPLRSTDAPGAILDSPAAPRAPPVTAHLHA